MMRVFVGVLFVMMSAAAAGLAHAAPATCLPFPPPTTPQPPVFTMSLDSFSSHGQLRLWRQACEDGSGEMATLARITSSTSTLFVCSINFTLSQGGANVDTLVSATPARASQCGDVTASTTFLLSQRSGAPAYRERVPFSLTHSGNPATFVNAPAPVVTILSTRCAACHVGDILSFEAHVVSGGPALVTEIKAVVRFPGGTVLSLFDIDRPLAAGETFDLVLIPDFVLPAGIAPPGTHVVEAAILEPGLGLLWSRASMRMQVQ